MAWHLKDRELEKKLNEISEGDFSVELRKIKEIDVGVYIGFGATSEEGGFLNNDYYYKKYKMFIPSYELEEVPEYNPNAWNEFPKVKPPYNVMMRVETYTGQGYKLFYNHLGDGDFWCDPNFLLMSEAFKDGVTRFRPWED
nr:MAG TPA: hypothetical protein [Caudoviricetes sp.]